LAVAIAMLTLLPSFAQAQPARLKDRDLGVSQPLIARSYSFMVFFDWDGVVVSDQGMKVVREAAVCWKTSLAGNTQRVQVIGATDTSGTDEYNMKLSQQRACEVYAALIREGIPPGLIATVGRGKHHLLVPTADGVREVQNRRVEIMLGGC
jgi:outer membrane protein OmpA-like peptidoglycan-associated protein